MYMTRSGDWLVTTDGQPLRVLTHNVKAGWRRVFQIEATPVSANR